MSDAKITWTAEEEAEGRRLAEGGLLPAEVAIILLTAKALAQMAEIDALRATVRNAHNESDPFAVTWILKHVDVIARAKEAENAGTL